MGYNQDSSEVTLRFEFTMYRDLFSGGAQFNDDAIFGVWSGNGGTWNHFATPPSQNYSDRADVPFEDNPCVDIPTDVGVEKAVYRFNVDLPVDGRDFLVAYQRCCRNPTINNLINPGDTGAGFSN